MGVETENNRATYYHDSDESFMSWETIEAFIKSGIKSGNFEGAREIGKYSKHPQATIRLINRLEAQSRSVALENQEVTVVEARIRAKLNSISSSNQASE